MKIDLESAARELTDLATRMYSDDPETLALVFEECARDIRRRLNDGSYLEAYGRFLRGTKPNDDTTR